MREDARVPTTFNNSIRAELRAIQGTRESKAKGQRLEALLARVLCSVRGMTLEAQDVGAPMRPRKLISISGTIEQGTAFTFWIVR